MKRILIFSLNYYPRFVGGAEVAIKEITDRITPDDVEFHMVTLRFDSLLPKVEKVGNVLVHRIGFTRIAPQVGDLKKFPLHFNKHLFQFFAAIKAITLHWTYHYDGIWAMMAHSAGVPAAIFKMVYSNVPYVLTLQEGDPPEAIKQTMLPVYPLFVRAFTRADVVQAISTFLGKWARDMGFGGPLFVIPNAVDVEHFSQAYEDKEIFALKQMLGKEHDDIFLITTSRLVKKNAVDDVIRALALLPKKVKFLILGIGPDEQVLRALAHHENVSDQVFFLGQVPHREMPLYLKVSDIFIRPSRSEGMGNSFVEAMAAGLPVIATQEGGLSDFIFDAKRNPDKETTAWAVDKDRPNQIAEAVKDILAHPEQVKKITETAYKLVSENYNWNLVTQRMGRDVFRAVFLKK